MKNFKLNGIDIKMEVGVAHLLAFTCLDGTINIYCLPNPNKDIDISGHKIGSVQGNKIESETLQYVMKDDSTFEVWLQLDEAFDEKGDTVLKAIIDSEVKQTEEVVDTTPATEPVVIMGNMKAF